MSTAPVPDPSLTPTSGDPIPTSSGHLRASDADRDRVLAVLNTAYADGRLTADEHDERSSAVMSAKTFAELVPLTHDLVAAPPAAVPAPANSRFQIEPSGSTEPDQMIAVFGGVERHGRWRMRRITRAFAMFGGIDLDLTEAVFESPVVEIEGAWVFGGLDIKVPEGVEIRDQVVSIFGGSDVKRVGEPQPGAPVLVIKGLCLFGGVSVKGPRPNRSRSRR